MRCRPGPRVDRLSALASKRTALAQHRTDHHGHAGAGPVDRARPAYLHALDKLVVDGYAVQTQDKPKRFTAKASVDLDAQN